MSETRASRGDRYLGPVSHDLACGIIAVFYFLHYATMYTSADWKAWSSSPEGYPGYFAGLASSLLAVLSHKYLLRRVAEDDARIDDERYREVLTDASKEARNPRKRFGLFGVVVVLLWGMTLHNWLTGAVSFKTYTWLAGCFVGVGVVVFTGMTLIGYCLLLNWHVVTDERVSGRIELRRGETFRELRKLNYINGTGVTTMLISFVPWSYYLFHIGRLDPAQKTPIAMIVVGVVLLMFVPYLFAMYRVHQVMENSRTAALKHIEANLGGSIDRVSGDQNPENARAKVEGLSILHSKIASYSTWPFSVDDWIKMSLPAVANVVPFIKKLAAMIVR